MKNSSNANGIIRKKFISKPKRNAYVSGSRDEIYCTPRHVDASYISTCFHVSDFRQRSDIIKNLCALPSYVYRMSLGIKKRPYTRMTYIPVAGRNVFASVRNSFEIKSPFICFSLSKNMYLFNKPLFFYSYLCRSCFYCVLNKSAGNISQ